MDKYYFPGPTQHASGITMLASAVAISNSTLVPTLDSQSTYRGSGQLSGEFPSALTTVEGVPVSAQVLVRYRAAVPGGRGDGLLVASTTSLLTGEWSIHNLNSSLRFDVSARYPGENDALQSNVVPFDEPRFSAAVQVPVGVPLDVALPIIGGTSSVSATYVSGSYPSGVSLVGGRLQGAWPTGATGGYPVTFDLTDDKGTFTHILNIELYLLPMNLAGSVPTLLVGEPVSATFTASGGEGPYTYSVSAGSLPTGLSLNSSTGALTGTPATPGAYSFEVTATDVRSAPASMAYSGAVFEDTPHRWWRVYITEANSVGYGSICELEFLDRNGVRHSLVGGTPVASSQYNASHSAAYAFDGLVNNDAGGNVWAPSNSTPPSWLGYQHANAVSVRAIRITARATANVAQSPKAFAIQCSDDGSTWTTVWSESGQTGWTGYEQRTFPRP